MYEFFLGSVFPTCEEQSESTWNASSDVVVQVKYIANDSSLGQSSQDTKYGNKQNLKLGTRERLPSGNLGKIQHTAELVLVCVIGWFNH